MRNPSEPHNLPLQSLGFSRICPDVNSSSVASADAGQREFPAFYSPAVVVPQGDNSYLVKPGKPVDKLTPKQAAKVAGVSVFTIYRLYHAGDIKGERASENSIRIFAESLQAHLHKTKDPEFWKLKKLLAVPAQ
jgi:excisionase family DNA binding protein